MTRRRDGAYYLFSDYDLRATCEGQRERMKAAIDDADASAIRAGDLEALTDTEVPGMTNTVGYVSLRELPPSGLVELILMKIKKA